MIESVCHCGAVKLEIAIAPEAVTDCNCSVCRRYGALWAYYPLDQVRIGGGPTDIYFWDDHSIDFHRCRVCGCVTHWAPVDKAVNRMGVNARLMAPGVLAAARVRHLDGVDTGKYVD